MRQSQLNLRIAMAGCGLPRNDRAIIPTVSRFTERRRDGMSERAYPRDMAANDMQSVTMRTGLDNKQKT